MMLLELLQILSLWSEIRVIVLFTKSDLICFSPLFLLLRSQSSQTMVFNILERSLPPSLHLLLTESLSGTLSTSFGLFRAHPLLPCILSPFSLELFLQQLLHQVKPPFLPLPASGLTPNISALLPVASSVQMKGDTSTWGDTHCLSP